MRLWDAILAEQAEPVDAASSSAASSSAKIEFLIDICCALLINLRERLLSNPEEEDRFARGIQVLQNYPDEDVGPIVEMAYVTRQRRLAASLTGDGPPLENEDADEAVGSSVRARAGNALRAWASSSSNNSTPSKGRAWFGSVGRSVSGSSSSSSPAPEVEFEQAHRSASVESTPNRSPGTMFQRYAEAFKSSDAAANLSKASTNWTATALATWDRDPASKSSPTTNGRLPSIGAVSSNLFKKARATQSPNGSPSTPETLHPASMRWSRDTMPDFPLPNMADSPPGRQEYPRGRPGSSTWPKHVAAPSSPASSLGQSPPNSPLPLPSLRAAAKLGMLPRHREPIGSVRGAGPKPLLLTGSARPPREGSGSFPAVDEPSRKISTGPLAASPHSRGTSQNGGGSSYAGSVTGRSENSASDDGSSVSRRTSLNDSAQSPTLEHAMRAPTSAGASFGEPASNGPIGLVGSGHGTGKGTVPAGAFAKVRAAAAGERADQLAANRLEADADSFCSTAPPPSERSEGANLNFGDASSSADVPLVPTAGRATRTRGRKEASSGGTGSGSDAGLQWEQTRSLVVGESDAVLRVRYRRQSKRGARRRGCWICHDDNLDREATTVCRSLNLHVRHLLRQDILVQEARAQVRPVLALESLVVSGGGGMSLTTGLCDRRCTMSRLKHSI